MSCKPICRLCPRFVISTAVAYDATTNTLNITIPNNGYRNCDKVCIVVAQTIPATTTINAQVFIFVGASSFPLTNPDCTPVVACQIKTRTKYSAIVRTTPTTGTFRLLCKPCCCYPDNLIALPVVDTTPAVANAEVQALSLNDNSVATAKKTTKTTKEVATNE